MRKLNLKHTVDENSLMSILITIHYFEQSGTDIIFKYSEQRIFIETN